jgi:hypothetical protein
LGAIKDHHGGGVVEVLNRASPRGINKEVPIMDACVVSGWGKNRDHMLVAIEEEKKRKGQKLLLRGLELGLCLG